MVVFGETLPWGRIGVRLLFLPLPLQWLCQRPAGCLLK